MAESENLDYQREVAEMEALIEELRGLRQIRSELAEIYRKQGSPMANSEKMVQLEYMEKCHNKRIEVFQLDAEIEHKRIILKELNKRESEQVLTEKALAGQCRAELPGKIELAKKLAGHPKVPKDLRHSINSRFIDPYNTRYRLRGFKNDGEAAGYFKALCIIIETAENWITK